MVSLWTLAPPYVIITRASNATSENKVVFMATLGSQCYMRRANNVCGSSSIISHVNASKMAINGDCGPLDGLPLAQGKIYLMDHMMINESAVSPRITTFHTASWALMMLVTRCLHVLFCVATWLRGCQATCTPLTYSKVPDCDTALASGSYQNCASIPNSMVNHRIICELQTPADLVALKTQARVLYEGQVTFAWMGRIVWVI